MPISEARKRANKKWNDAHPYDKLYIFVPLGGKEYIKAVAAEEGESVNEFVNKAVLERLHLDSWDETKGKG